MGRVGGTVLEEVTFPLNLKGLRAVKGMTDFKKREVFPLA